MVSVIIPVYNSSKTIIKAIDSVLNQGYKEVEVIVVDDSSTDDTMNILHSYDDEKKVRIFHIEHQGCVVAYTYGIKKAKYPYIMMLDSDDEYKKDYIEKMLYLIEYHNTDGVASSYDNEENNQVSKVVNKLNTGMYLTSNINKICNKAFSNQFDIIPVRWNHIYKKEIIMSFIDEINPKIKQREDNIFNYLYLKNSYNIYIDNDLNSYIYHVNPNSVTNKYNASYFYDFYESVNYLYKISNDIEGSKALLIDSISICLSKAIDSYAAYIDLKYILKTIGRSELLLTKPKNINEYSLKEKIAIHLIIKKRFQLLYSSYKILKRNK
jgi:glycosyltransferase involved in cell wall biosynthesis